MTDYTTRERLELAGIDIDKLRAIAQKHVGHVGGAGAFRHEAPQAGWIGGPSDMLALLDAIGPLD